jgi:hypothetical protein
VNHVDAVSSLAVSKDGYFLYSASRDRKFKICALGLSYIHFKLLYYHLRAFSPAVREFAHNQEGTGSYPPLWRKFSFFKKKHN